jgi:hypothetical protein
MSDHQVNDIQLSTPSSSDATPTTDMIESCMAEVVAAPAAIQRCATAAIGRCSAFTASVELWQLVAVLDASIQRTLDRMAAQVEALGHSLAPAGAPSMTKGARGFARRFDLLPLPQSILQQLLQLPLALAAQRRCIALVDTEVRTHASAVLEIARALHDSTPVPARLPPRMVDVVTWRLSDHVELDKALGWKTLLMGVLLPKSAAALGVLEEIVEALLIAALCAPARQALLEVCLPSSAQASCRQHVARHFFVAGFSMACV